MALVETGELNAHFIHRRGFVMRGLKHHTDSLVRASRRDLRCAVTGGGGRLMEADS